MELKPVYLLAPEPEPRRVSRRALVLGAFAAFTCGFGAGVAVRRVSRPVGPAVDDAALQWARALQEEPIEVLEREATSFLAVVATTRDASLGVGIERLAEWAIDADDAPRTARVDLARRLEALLDEVPDIALPRKLRAALKSLR
ncbi:MAG: hypothetical protein IT457_15385 [Planctomycetes bacterium]|nr:hypothetical protein [Planctomycetota bacterium]